MKPMRFSRATWGWIGFGVALLAFAIYAAVHWFEIVDDTEWIGVKGEAAVNPYLALEKLLVEQGASVTPLRSITTLDAQLEDSSARVLILADKRLPYMTPARVAAIERWVNAGGHLIVEAEAPHLDDPLLIRWSLDRKRLVWRRGQMVEVDRKRPGGTSTNKTQNKNGNDINPDDEEMEFPVEPTPNNGRRSRAPSPFSFNPTAAPMQSTSRITLSDGMTFRAIFTAYQNLVPAAPNGGRPLDPSALIRDRTGGRMAEFPMGRGRVTAISNFDFMAWKALSRADHAELIWHLVSSGGEQAKPTVAMLTRPISTGFSNWLATNAWMVLVSLAALIAFWIWHVLPRFGPLMPATTTARRSLGEHIRAAGGWLARRGEWSALVEPVRARFWSRLMLRHPGAASMAMAERLQLAASLTGLSLADTNRLLTADISSRRDCLAAIRTLMAATTRLDGDAMRFRRGLTAR
jgi:hypothetical protein